MTEYVKQYKQGADGRMLVGHVPVGAMCMQVGSCHERLPAIHAIDWDTFRYRANGEDWRPFPSNWYRDSDITWTEVNPQPVVGPATDSALKTWASARAKRKGFVFLDEAQTVADLEVAKMAARAAGAYTGPLYEATSVWTDAITSNVVTSEAAQYQPAVTGWTRGETVLSIDLGGSPAVAVTVRGTRHPDGDIRWVADRVDVIDPLDVTYDGVALRALLDGDEFNRQERGGDMWRAKKMTPAQRAAVSAHLSTELRAKVAAKAAADRERDRNVVTMDGEEW